MECFTCKTVILPINSEISFVNCANSYVETYVKSNHT